MSAGSPFHEPDGFDPALADELWARIKAELQPGERLVWSALGRPARRSGCARAVASALAAAGLATAGWALAAFLGLGHVPVRDGGVLVLGGVGLLVGGLLTAGLVAEWRNVRADPCRLAGGLYALTDRRAIIWRRSPYRRGAVEVTSLARGRAGIVRRVEDADGSGDVLFSVLDQATIDGPAIAHGFERIADVRRVEDLVKRTLLADGAD
jgi:hypothetical protein